MFSVLWHFLWSKTISTSTVKSLHKSQKWGSPPDSTSASSTWRNSTSISRAGRNVKDVNRRPGVVLKCVRLVPAASLTPMPSPSTHFFGTNLNITLLRNKEAFSDPHTLDGSLLLCPVTAALFTRWISFVSPFPTPQTKGAGTCLSRSVPYYTSLHRQLPGLACSKTIAMETVHLSVTVHFHTPGDLAHNSNRRMGIYKITFSHLLIPTHDFPPSDEWQSSSYIKFQTIPYTIAIKTASEEIKIWMGFYSRASQPLQTFYQPQRETRCHQACITHDY